MEIRTIKIGVKLMRGSTDQDQDQDQDQKNKEMAILEQQDIKSKIYTIRGKQVMLDSDLADLYQVETKYLKRQVRRNFEKFPNDFMFEITKEDANFLRCQFVTLENKGRGEHSKYLAFVFTESGVSMLASVLNSQKAIQISIQIIRAFVEMRRFLIYNAQIFQRFDNIERNFLEHKLDSDKKFDKIFEALEENEIQPKQGIFFDGQIFDAYKFVADLIRKAKKSICIIDNFVDDTVLTLLTKKNKDVKIKIYTKNISRQLILDIKKFNSQYSGIEIKEFKDSHDRFIILDEKEVYLVGASLKDLGKKWFAFSKLEIDSFKLLEKLEI
jgi:phage regulator Rha-like protein